MFCPGRRTPTVQDGTNTGDIPDGLTTPPRYPGTLGDYAANLGTTGGDYWWDGVTTGGTTVNTPTNGVFLLANNWIVGGTGYRTGFKIPDISDGLSNTLMIGEKHVPVGQYGDFNSRDGAAYNGDKASSAFGAASTNLPAKGPTDTRTGCFGSSHSGIVQFVLCDGAVRAISVGINGTVYANLANRMDGNVVDGNQY